jgi:RNase P/RNase MRP subunit p30
MIDFVFPKNNEEEFIKIAKKLGNSSLCFVYPYKNFKKKTFKTDLEIKQAIITDQKNINNSKNLTDIVLIQNTKNSINIRLIIEKNKNIVFFDIEDKNQKDFIHQRRSNLNHIICNLANKNNITFGFSFNSFLHINIKERNILMGRIKANIRLCKKYKNKIIISSFAKNPYEMRNYNCLKTFFKTFGL